jgi:hypothetical protein
MATQILLVLSPLRLLGIAAALWCSLASAVTCTYPPTANNSNPIITYTVSYTPVTTGNVTLEYFMALTCSHYMAYSLDAKLGSYHINVVQGLPVYVRLTLTSTGTTVRSTTVMYYLNPPNAPQLIGIPAAPTGFKVT